MLIFIMCILDEGELSSKKQPARRRVVLGKEKVSQLFFQRLSAAFFAISVRCSSDKAAAREGPPFFPPSEPACARAERF